MTIEISRLECGVLRLALEQAANKAKQEAYQYGRSKGDDRMRYRAEVCQVASEQYRKLAHKFVCLELEEVDRTVNLPQETREGNHGGYAQ